MAYLNLNQARSIPIGIDDEARRVKILESLHVEDVGMTADPEDDEAEPEEYVEADDPLYRFVTRGSFQDRLED